MAVDRHEVEPVGNQIEGSAASACGDSRASLAASAFGLPE
jgi:hypothetical protein